ncbi:hypothetical protein [Streptomyces ossamyceticus]|uniref:hypothetical protein n=1 Tax=Streptomyces ossamyceticus TaxID=249581 RepID=UPI003426F1E3
MNGSGDSRRGPGSDGRHGDSEGRAMPSGRAESDMGERRHCEAGQDGRPARNDAPAPVPERPTDSPSDRPDNAGRPDADLSSDGTDAGHTENSGRPGAGVSSDGTDVGRTDSGGRTDVDLFSDRTDAGPANAGRPDAGLSSDCADAGLSSDGAHAGHTENPGRPDAGLSSDCADAGHTENPGRSDAGLSGAGVPPADASSVGLLLAVAVRGRPEVDSAGEARALAAFRAARELGPRTTRTRRRDDWRPNPRRRVQLSVRTTLAVLLSSLTLGGVAFAAIGSATRHDAAAGPGRAEDGRTGTSHSAPAAPGPSGTPGAGSSTGDRPANARDTEAQCRAYEKTEGRGGALDATVLRRLSDAAGGTEKVTAYCAARLGDADDAEDREQRAGDSAGKRDGTERSTGAGAGRRSDDTGVPAGTATGKPDGAGEPTAPGTSDEADRQGQADQEGRTDPGSQTDSGSQTDQAGREDEPKVADAPGRVDGADKTPETK